MSVLTSSNPKERAWAFVLGAALVLPVTLVEWLTNDLHLARSGWQLSSGLLLFVACRWQWSTWAQAGAVAVVCAALPWLMWWEHAPFEQLTSAYLLPVVVGGLFIEQPVVVAAAVAAGGASVETVMVLLSGGRAGPTEVVGLGLGYAMVLVGAARVREVMARERLLEQGQALRLSEVRRAQAERLAVVGRLASGVAHEINNPLAYVKANLSVLQRELKLGGLTSQDVEELLSETNEGVDRICQIVLDLKMLAREGKEELEGVDVAEAVHAAVRLATVKLPSNVQVRLDVPELLPWVRANRRKLAQVLLNLIINAIDVLEERKPAKGVILVRARGEEGQLRVEVLDDGPGFSAEVKAHLFEPFFTTKSPGKGTGLGLALSREYLESFGGTLGADNRPEGGACFTLLLTTVGISGETPFPPALRSRVA
jgi:signal transduction histidine kinase